MIFNKICLKYSIFTLFLVFFEAFTADLQANDSYNETYKEEHLNQIIEKRQDGLLANFQDWGVYRTNRSDRFICYILSTPITKEGSKIRRGESYFLVTNLVNDADEITAASGFAYKKTSNVEMSFGTSKFYLFPYISIAWAHDKNDDIDIIKAMQKGDNFIITATSADGKIVSDTYSLIGFRKAYIKLKEICKND